MKIVSKRHPNRQLVNHGTHFTVVGEPGVAYYVNVAHPMFRKKTKLPFDAINGGRLGFSERNGLESECKRCGWTVDEYLNERDHRVFNKLAPFDWVTDEMLAGAKP